MTIRAGFYLCDASAGPVRSHPLRSLKAFLALVCVVLALAGCATLPRDVVRHPSAALADPAGTALGRELGQASALLKTPPRASGFRLLTSGDESYAALVQLIDQAERTLDLQYYLIENDETTRNLLQHVDRSAQRGVRVRILIDDLHTVGEDDALALLAQRQNVEVRAFNPFPAGRESTITRVGASAFDLRRIGRRMHNKLCVADNTIAATGGRNLGSRYFVRNSTNNFVDLDVLVAGPAVRQLSSAFDRYWNSDLAYPIESLSNARSTDPVRTPSPAPEDRAQLAAGIERSPGQPAELFSCIPEGAAAGYSNASNASNASNDVPPQHKLLDGLTWIDSTVLVDDPSKVVDPKDAPDPDETLADDLYSLLKLAKEEIIIITPYLVPGDEGVRVLSEARRRGVEIRILTNSFGSVDEPIVHIGYSRYRPQLLKLGAELHELQPTLPRNQVRFGRFGSSQSTLHAKAVIIDRRILFIGSMNFDPRSAVLNTEMAVVVRSPVLAREVARLFEETARAGSYRVSLRDDGKGLLWTAENGGTAPTYVEPQTTFFKRLGMRLIAPFVPDEQL